MNNIYRHLILGSGGSNTPPPPTGNLTLTFSDFSKLPTGVTDETDLVEWNTTFSSNYTSVSVVGFVVTLVGGSGVTIPSGTIDNCSTNLLSVVDTGSVVEIGDNAFKDCSALSMIEFQQATVIGDYAFSNCIAATDILFPQATTISPYAFGACTSATIIDLSSCTDLGGTVIDDGVFVGTLSANIITLTIPTSLMTCDGGNPDGDIDYLQANNTVTIVTV